MPDQTLTAEDGFVTPLAVVLGLSDKKSKIGSSADNHRLGQVNTAKSATIAKETLLSDRP
jgi:hypothetical protein